MKTGNFGVLFSAFGILLLILDSRTAISGGQLGMELCIYSVIPSIFPFIVLSGTVTPAIGGRKFRILGPLGRLLGIPQGSEGLFLTGILGGYPTGAIAVRQAWEAGKLSATDARRMLAFSSQAGPAFIFGILSCQFPHRWMLWLLWAVHVLSAVLVAAILPGKNGEQCPTSSAPSHAFTDTLKRSVVTMGCICGWIVLFRVILAFCDRWFLWLLPRSLQVGFYGFLELANGCCALDSLSVTGSRFILCSAMLSFGGICVLMQTASVTGKLGLGLYLPGKILQAFISIVLSYYIQLFCFPRGECTEISPFILLGLILSVTFIAIFAGKKQIRGSIPQLFGV